MKKPLLALLLSAVCFTPTAKAISIENEVGNIHGFTFDVYWGPVQMPTASPPVHTSFQDIGVAAFDTGSVVTTFAVYLPEGPPFYYSIAEFVFPNLFSRSFVPPTLSGAGPPPLSITPLPGGFGAHFVYGPIFPHPAEDSVASAFLLGFALLSCFSVKLRELLD